MRVEWLAGIGCLLLAATQASGGEREITVGLRNADLVPLGVLVPAKAAAAGVYSGVGLKLQWRSRSSTRLWIQFDAHAPADFHPGALGYAAPYRAGGISIHILIDRVLNAGSQKLSGVLLGHVIAHELGHVLEAVDRHSETGIMKAYWNQQDYDKMLFGQLSFSPDDAELIRMGLARWVAGQ